MRVAIKRFAFLFGSFFFLQPASQAASPDSTFAFIFTSDTLFYTSPENIVAVVIISDSVLKKNKIVPIKRKRIIAALLAFPLPFGVLGLHRIYLGTKPYMPFAYIGTLGGCFGILPLIDFITILTSDEEMLKRFKDNPKVIMWSH